MAKEETKVVDQEATPTQETVSKADFDNLVAEYQKVATEYRKVVAAYNKLLGVVANDYAEKVSKGIFEEVEKSAQ